MPGPGTTSTGKNAKLVKQGHTTTGKFGDGYNAKGQVPSVKEVSPKG